MFNNILYLIKKRTVNNNINNNLDKLRELTVHLSSFESEQQSMQIAVEIAELGDRLREEINERRKLENRLKCSLEKYRVLIETTSDRVWEVNSDLIYTYVSPKVQDILGYEPDEVLGKAPYDFIHPDEIKRIRKIVKRHIKHRESFKYLENINIHKDGHLVILETNASIIIDENGVFQGYRGIDKDITRRKNLELEKGMGK